MRILRPMWSSKFIQSTHERQFCWNDCQETSYHLDWWYPAANKNQKRAVEKFGILSPRLEILKIESCTERNQHLFEISLVHWKHCFRQRNSTSYQKSPRPKKLGEHRKQRNMMRIEGSLGFCTTFKKNCMQFQNHSLSSWEMTFY